MADDMPEWQRNKLGAVFSLAVGLVAALAVGQFEPPTFAKVAGCSAATITCMWAFFRAELKGYWFWWFMAAVVTGHAIIVFAVLWPIRHKIGNWDVRVVGLADLVPTFIVGALLQYLTRNTVGPRSSA